MKTDTIELPEGITIPTDARVYLQSPGYFRIHQKDGTGKISTMMLHRYIYEQVHGPLPPDYVVHHVNGQIDDNRPENLIAMPRSEHSRLHRLTKMPTSPSMLSYCEAHKEQYHRQYLRRKDKKRANAPTVSPAPAGTGA